MTRSNSNDESESVDEKRARFERFAMTVCANGVVNVANQSYGDEAGAHTIGSSQLNSQHHLSTGELSK